MGEACIYVKTYRVVPAAGRVLFFSTLCGKPSKGGVDGHVRAREAKALLREHGRGGSGLCKTCEARLA